MTVQSAEVQANTDERVWVPYIEMQLLKPSWVNHDGDKAIFGVDIHPDGSRFATGGQGQDSSGRVVIWNLHPVISEKSEFNEKVPKLLCQLDQHLGCVNSVRWSQSGNYLASAGDDKVIIIWQQSGYGGGTVFGSNVVNVESWRIVSTLRGHAGDILDVAWSPQDLWLASASVDNNVIVWNASKWPEQICVLRGHTGLVKGVTWDPIGRYLASQADDKSMRIWRTSTWTTEHIITDPFVECGGTTSVLRPSWSPDGQYLVSAHAMNNGGPTAQIVERDGWSTDKDFVGHRKAITCVRFNPNILCSKEGKQSKNVQYCCVAIGSRDRSVSIWFTSLKRPLVVVHDIFEDSILDLSWSRCGKHLMAVSKDGTLGFISFSETEIGRALTEEQTIKSHMKLYGSTDFNVSSVTPTIIENPELLKFQEEQKIREKKVQSQSMEEMRAPTPTGPTNKQIEMRTADGRRRITPMFIPPPPKSETSAQQLEEESFSSSRPEKSKIIVERVDGIVEPNVSSPNKSSRSDHESNDRLVSKTQAPPLPDLDAIPTTLASRIETPQEDGGFEKVSTIQVKRKGEDCFGSRKKRRGRPPVFAYEKEKNDAGNATGSFNSSRPPSPVHSDRRPQKVSAPSTLVQRDILAPSSMPRVSRIELPDVVTEDGGKSMLLYERDWKVADKIGPGLAGKLPSLHRVSRWDSGNKIWATYVNSEAAALAATKFGIILACSNGSMHLLSCDNGEHVLPPIQLSGRPSQLFIERDHAMALTTDGFLAVWNVREKKRLLHESVRHLVDHRGGVKNVQMFGEEDSKTPAVVLKSGEAFSWFEDLGSWVQLGESMSVRRFINPEFSLIDPFQSTSLKNPLSAILASSGAYSSSSRLSVSSVSGEIRRSLTEAFLKRMLTSAKHVNSEPDFRMWHRRLAKHYISEGMEKELRKMFDDLLGPISNGVNGETSNGEVAKSWNSKIMGVDKRELLKEYLRDILLAENSIHLQRLHSEFNEQLKETDEFAI